jgi:hypothetical protein
MPTTLTTGLLRCAVSRGMFPDEYAVEFSTDANQKVSLFASEADLEQVDKNLNTGLLKVMVYGVAGSNVVSVLLPSETLEQGRNLVNVPKGQLVG